MHYLRSKQFIFYSCVLHLICIAVNLFFINALPHQKCTGLPMQSMIKVDLIQENEIPMPSTTQNSAPHQAETTQKKTSKTLILNHKKMLTVNKKQTLSQNKPSPKKTKQQQVESGEVGGMPVNQLLQLLHAKIAAHQHYPVTALEMGREGRVTIGFILTPTGDIHDLHVIHSSATPALDEAALAAVREAMPFKQIGKWLHIAQTFTIDIVFALA